MDRRYDDHRPVASNNEMITDLRVFLDGQPFSVDSDQKLDFTPGGSTGSSLSITFRAEFSVPKQQYDLRLLFKDETTGKPLSGKGLTLRVVADRDQSGGTISGTLERDGSVLFQGLLTETRYIFVEGAGVNRQLQRRPDELVTAVFQPR